MGKNKIYKIDLYHKDNVLQSLYSSNIKEIFSLYFRQLENYLSVKRTKELLKVKFTNNMFIQPVTNDYKIICTRDETKPKNNDIYSGTLPIPTTKSFYYTRNMKK